MVQQWQEKHQQLTQQLADKVDELNTTTEEIASLQQLLDGTKAELEQARATIV